MILRRPALARLLALAVAIGGVAGCGSSSSSSNGVGEKSPEQIVEASKGAAAKAATVHISGSTISEGKPISLDMELAAGKGAKGRISVEGLRIDIVELEHAFYLKGSPAFYRRVGGAAAAQLLEGKWLKAPASSGDFASLAKLTDLGTVIDSALASHGPLVQAGSTTVAGQPAVGVTDTSKGGTLYVASTGTPYPLEISKHGKEGGRILFDRWNEPVTITPPANAININQLQNGR